ncbi:putative B3 domain-containing protein Os03g0621600 isoform X2 [Mercurialis annua]|uniref:putative B3 domain-containing protein Os03g0621600 isoform X2 n=1 Tax=Mercurialis annua TaxID=3986 RepID=UPI00215F520C|nr:putative B3 domain-containing protein Os03g0621600 isoform X2 [Mercurialis annua]
MIKMMIPSAFVMEYKKIMPRTLKFPKIGIFYTVLVIRNKDGKLFQEAELSKTSGIIMENGIHFFKILLNADIQAGKIRMPKMFVKEHGNSLSNPVILEVPINETWEVELSRPDDDVWLDKGWKEFADFYSLEHGSFLLFRYEGDCRFSMKICEKGGLEITYPIGHASSSRQKAPGKRQVRYCDRYKDASSDDDHVDQSKNLHNAYVDGHASSVRQKAAGKRQVPYCDRYKDASSDDDHGDQSKNLRNAYVDDGHASSVRQKPSGNRQAPYCDKYKDASSDDDHGDQSKNLGNAYVDDGHASSVRQKAAGKRRVRYCDRYEDAISDDDHGDQSKNYRNAYVDDYKEKRKSDVSKLASDSTRGIKETIVKKRGRPKSSKQSEKPQVSATKTGDKAEKRSDIKMKHPFIELVLKDYHRFSLVITKGFANSSGLINMRKTCIQDPVGRQWPLLVHIMSTNQLRLSTGWSNFYRANELATGDTLVLYSKLGFGSLIIAEVHKCGRPEL